MRRIYEGVLVDGTWKIRTNVNIEESDIVTIIKQRRIRLSRHVQRMPEDKAMKKVSLEIAGKRTLRGRPRKILVEDFGKLKIRRLRREVQDRLAWRGVVLEARALQYL